MCGGRKPDHHFRLYYTGRSGLDRRYAVITSGLKVIAVDPGVFTATLSRKLITPNKKKQKTKILAVVGSVNANTTAQMEELWLSQRTHNEFVHTRELLEGENAENWRSEGWSIPFWVNATGIIYQP